MSVLASDGPDQECNEDYQLNTVIPMLYHLVLEKILHFENSDERGNLG